MMSPDDLRAAITEIYGQAGARAMARHLTERGVLNDRDGSHMRKMLGGTRPIGPAVEAEVTGMLRLHRERPPSPPRPVQRRSPAWLLGIVRDIRRRRPRASLVYAEIILMLAERGPMPLSELAAEIDDDADSSTVQQAVTYLERIGVLHVDRAPTRREGHSVALVAPASKG